MAKVGIIGGGAAECSPLCRRRDTGTKCICMNRMRSLGKVVYHRKGRCNFTNACPAEEFFQNIVSNAKFMYSSGYGYTSQDIMAFLNSIVYL